MASLRELSVSQADVWEIGSIKIYQMLIGSIIIGGSMEEDWREVAFSVIWADF